MEARRQFILSLEQIIGIALFAAVKTVRRFSIEDILCIYGIVYAGAAQSF